MSESFEVKDFSGGMTDYPFDSPINKVSEARNLLLELQGSAAKFILRPGSARLGRIPEGNQRVSTLINHKDYLVIITGKRFHYYRPGSVVMQITVVDTLQRCDANSTTSVARAGELTMIATDAYDNPLRLSANSLTQVATLITGGLPPCDPNGDATLSPVGGAGSGNYLFKIVYRYQYSTGDTVRTVYGTPSAAKIITSAYQVQITQIPVVITNTLTNWPVNPEVEIYRTVSNGTVFYYDGVVTSPVNSYTSTVSDAILQTRKRLYTEGGVLPNTIPPRARIVHAVGEFCYYGNIKLTDAPDTFTKHRLYQSIPGILDAVPPTFFIDLDGDIEGISSVSSNVIVMCANSVYRIDGNFDSLGRGGMVAKRISDTASCVSAQSVVQTIDGVYWAGFDGIYYSNGFSVLRISDDNDVSWARFVTLGGDLNRRKRIVGKYDRQKQRIWWTIRSGNKIYPSTPTGNATLDNDAILVLDLRFGKDAPNAPFTIMTGDYNVSTNYFIPTALEYMPTSGFMMRADRRGFIYTHRKELISDTNYNADFGASWGNDAEVSIEYSMKTTNMSFGDHSNKKYIPRIGAAFEFKAESSIGNNFTVGLQTVNDGGSVLKELDEFKITRTAAVKFGEVVSVFNKWRHFAAGSLRSIYRQVRFYSKMVKVWQSTPVGQPLTVLATVAGNVVTIDMSTLTGELNLAQYAQDKFIYLSNDYVPYQYAYRILKAQTSGFFIFTLTVDNGQIGTGDDSSGPLLPPIPGSNVTWYIQGVHPNQSLNLLSYTIELSRLGHTTEAFKTSEGS